VVPSAPGGIDGILRQRSNQEGLFEKPQVVGDGLEGPCILKLPLNLLERDDLCGRSGGDTEDLAEQRRAAHGGQRKDIAADGRLDDRVADVGRPAARVFSQLEGSRI
jgi:hypothetical protein